MWRFRATLPVTGGWFAALLLGATQALAEPRIAIIIDDLGNHIESAQHALQLPGAVTYSILPQRPYSHEVALRANALGREVMLHLPMQSTDGHALGPGGLHVEMDRQSFRNTLLHNLTSVPFIAGVNNHMGSRLTREREPMRWLMQTLGRAGGLYFVDSRTDAATVAQKVACENGLPNARRDVFLDNEPGPVYAEAQFDRLLEAAQRRGSAIAIGHPNADTLAVLARRIPQLKRRGIRLVSVSDLITLRRSDSSWHACSSPLPTVAKN